MKKYLSLPLLLSGLVSCSSLPPTKAPEYARPISPIELTLPIPQDDEALKIASPFGWEDLFKDARLQNCIRLALENNRDLRIASANLEKSRAGINIANSTLFPTINAGGGASTSQTSGAASANGQSSNNQNIAGNIGFSAYEIDFFGRLRSLRDVANENFYSAKENSNSIKLSLISQIAANWLAIATDQDALKMAQQTNAAWNNTLRLIEARHDHGIASGLDVSSARAQAEQSRLDIATITTKLNQDKASLNLLVGANVQDNLLPDTFADGQFAPSLPIGLSSQILLNRPDVLAAEHGLKAANANIGVARAAFFPRITLTSSLGLATRELGNLFSSNAGAYSFAANLTAPIFDNGANQANLDIAQASRDGALATYEKAIQTAFSEVANGLAIRAQIDERLSAQRAIVSASQRSVELANARFRAGLDSYLTLLIAQRTLYAAQQNLINLENVRAANIVALYKALGNDKSF